MLLVDINRVEDVMKADVFSLLYLVGTENVNSWFHYALQVVNLFEVMFICLIAGGLSHYLGGRLSKGIVFTIATYGVGLLSWVLLVTFLIINISPQ